MQLLNGGASIRGGLLLSAVNKEFRPGLRNSFFYSLLRLTSKG